MRILKIKRDNGQQHYDESRYERALTLLVQTGYVDAGFSAQCRASLPDARSVAEALVEEKVVPAQILSKALTIAQSGDADLPDNDAAPTTNPVLNQESGPSSAAIADTEAETGVPDSGDVTREVQMNTELAYSSTASEITDLGGEELEANSTKLGFTAGFTFRANAENAPEVVRDADLMITPPVRTELAIEETVYPSSIPQDEPNEVRWTVTLKNVRRAKARDVTLSLDDMPSWFKPSEVMLENETMSRSDGELTHVQIGDIMPGESKSIVFIGTASP